MKIKQHSILDDNLDYVKTHTRKQIAEHFELTYNQVNNWCNSRGIHPIRERQEKYQITDEFIEFANTHTINEICKAFHLCYGTIQTICKVRNIKPIKHRPAKIQFEKTSASIKRTGEAMDMIKALIPTFTDASIARVFGYSKERIRQIRSELGVEK